MRKHVYFGVIPWDQPAIVPDLFRRLNHGWIIASVGVKSLLHTPLCAFFRVFNITQPSALRNNLVANVRRKVEAVPAFVAAIRSHVPETHKQIQRLPGSRSADLVRFAPRAHPHRHITTMTL
jgi:hypothetical protein